jgi:hypothetical protein
MRATVWLAAGAIAIVGMELACAEPACAQAAQREATVETTDGGMRQTLESIVVPPKTGAPFMLTLHTEWVKPMADGNTTTLVNERHIARDSMGRIYQQRVMLEPKAIAEQGHWTTNVIQIMDPSEHTLFNCWMFPSQKKTCDELNYTASTNTVYRPATVITGPLPGNRGTAQYEDLGSQSIVGVATHGSRNTIRYNAGAMGNDQPMTVVQEFWYSDELGINLISVRNDPRLGKQTFTVTDMQLGEPDPKLFELPADFKVVDRRDPAQTQAPADAR